ncbi:hypothetical protein ACE6H2_001925 [Prunus campanulata]
MHTCLILNVLNNMKAANSMALLTSSKLSALRALRSVLIVYTDDASTQSLNAPLVCPHILKEEFNGCKKPSFVDSRSGWFALSPFSCMSKPKFSAVSTTTALAIKTQSTENSVSQSYLSDTIVLQINRITFLLLKFLCLQDEGAARRAEEVGFVDLDHFPELPMPEILHGLQGT